MSLTTYTPSQIQTIKRTVAKDTNADEFDLFMEACRSYHLDPFRKQISAIVFNKDNAAKRQMSIIVSRDGYRVLAQRCGDYRPASDPVEYEMDESLKSGTNPSGVVKASTRLWKQDRKGDWYPVYGEAYWDEFAPIKDEWAWNEQQRKRTPTGKKTVEGNWAKMPRVMIAKCAESQALRAGWPDQFGGVYSEEEMDRAVTIDAQATASEIVAQQEAEDRERRVGRGIVAIFDGPALESVPSGQFYDRAIEHIRDMKPEKIYEWSVSNRESLKQFWAEEPSDALALKREIEKAEKAMRAASKAAA